MAGIAICIGGVVKVDFTPTGCIVAVRTLIRPMPVGALVAGLAIGQSCVCKCGRNPVGCAMTIGTLPGVMTEWSSVASQAVSETGMIKGDVVPTVLVVAVGA